MLSVGLIGAGFMGKTHSMVYKELSSRLDIRLSGVADVREDFAKKVSRSHNIPVYASAEALIQDPAIHAVDICLPTYLHAKYARLAMEAGKHVFIEKPVVLTPEEGETLLQVQQKTGAKVMVGQCIRMWPAYLYLKKVYEEGCFGPLRNLSMSRISSVPSWGFENWYHDTKKCGGAALDLHIHDVDFMRYLLGEPDRMQVSGDIHHVFSLFDYQAPRVTVQIEGSWDYPGVFPFVSTYRALFDGALVAFDQNCVTVYTDDGRQHEVDVCRDLEQEDDFEGKIKNLGGYYTELKYFYEQLLKGEEAGVATLEEGVRSVRLVYKEMEIGDF